MRASIRIAAVLGLALAGLFIAVPTAGAYVYWANGEAGTIGRAANDGSHVDPDFITGAGGPISVAVDASHIYWASGGPYHEIGRASISGGSVEPEFIKTSYELDTVALNGSHIYWASTTNLIGRANLDGGNPEPDFVGEATAPCGLAFDAGHIYWASGTFTPGHIGRIALSGTPPASNEFVTVSPVGVLCGVAVTSSSVYWADSGLGGGTNIGRASLSNPGSPDVSFIGGALGPCGLTLSESKLYWANSGTSTIARANTDGTDVEYEWIHTGAEPRKICGAAVDALAPPPEPPPGPGPGPGGGGGGSGADKTPPQTKITKGPGKKLAQGKAKFALASSEPGSRFTCKLDNKRASACRSPKSYAGLKPGRHAFKAWATDAAGNKDPTPAKRSFKVPAA